MNAHRFLRVLQRSEKLWRCYTQNLDELEARIDLNADIKSKNCDVIQLHDNLNFFRCSYCSHLTNWNVTHESSLCSEAKLSCLECESRIESQRKNEARTNIHIEHLRPNVVLLHDIDDSWSEIKANFIDKDSSLRLDVLLIIETSLTSEDSRYELKSKLISMIHRSGENVIYINNKLSFRAFAKPVVDHILKMNCDLWVQDLAVRQSFLWDNDVVNVLLHLSRDLDFQSTAQTVDEVIREVELKLISLDDYFDYSFRIRMSEEVKEKLSCFLSQHWLSTFLLMCILSLFKWNEFTRVLHSKHVNFEKDDVHRSKMLKESLWLIERKHTRIILLYCCHQHWILIMIDIQIRTITYYSSLTDYDLRDCCEFIETQMKRVDERFDRDYSTWNSSVEDVSMFFHF